MGAVVVECDDEVDGVALVGGNVVSRCSRWGRRDFPCLLGQFEVEEVHLDAGAVTIVRRVDVRLVTRQQASCVGDDLTEGAGIDRGIDAHQRAVTIRQEADSPKPCGRVVAAAAVIRAVGDSCWE